jgi:hypothetical protein
LLGLFLQEAEPQVIKTCTQIPGLSRGFGLRKGVSGVLAATILLAFSSGAHADVFGGAAAQVKGQPTALEQRLAALERELAELKAKGPQGVPAAPGAPARGKSAGRPNGKGLPKVKPPPGLEGLPGGGADERERLIVEKELTHEVLGTVNGMLLVRDGDKRIVLSETEFKAFEKKKRETVINRMKVEAVTEGDGARVNFPQLTPPPPPVPEGSELTPAGSAVDQARAIEANGGKPPAPPPAQAVTPTNGQHKPASPVKKN